MKKFLPFILIVGIVIYLIKPFIENLLLRYYGTCVNAIIINNSIRVRYHKAEFKYRFMINGTYYEGNSLITDNNQIGDSICVIYLKGSPSTNRPENLLGGKHCRCKN
ncbi:hypothetical protein C8P68_106153 [Mucilaginibacter yixingensis]|uniref:DUF3592 domain-containing protein n=1 Tax=Mucilaginibacter yixingensis TaxID=1295612 RepID=A0A2T5J754_9SPHI|nr:hypothetical protein C8P68_106153 [Mucilaginibacter yixingensis]